MARSVVLEVRTKLLERPRYAVDESTLEVPVVPRHPEGACVAAEAAMVSKDVKLRGRIRCDNMGPSPFEVEQYGRLTPGITHRAFNFGTPKSCG